MELLLSTCRSWQPSQLTYADFQAFPEDNLRRELIDGELIVTDGLIEGR